jgi:3-deoxy-manno-octulosonate cytidylyltransferase (CMP-KDO synthetase)
MKIIAVIPARYQSSRFPGKPLVDLCGKPMIWWVFQHASEVDMFEEVWVATDSQAIADECVSLGIPVIMTSSAHKTGTDRVAEVAQQRAADLYVNIQGDEPLLESATIRMVIEPFLVNSEISVANLMSRIINPVDALNPTIPKVITNDKGEGIYLSRSLSPFPKGELDYLFYKQVCVYGFTAQALDFFRSTPRGRLERIEDIEILRFIENGIKVQYLEVETNSIAIDTPNDAERVRRFMDAGGFYA